MKAQSVNNCGCRSRAGSPQLPGVALEAAGVTPCDFSRCDRTSVSQPPQETRFWPAWRWWVSFLRFISPAARSC